MKATLYTIECISNMHVGSGKDNFGVIDRLIQRDAITGYPCINASGLKGALLEHCKQQKMNQKLIDIIFGKEGDSKNNISSEQGKYRFLDAQLLALPIPAKEAPYKLITSKGIVEELKKMAAMLGLTLTDDTINKLRGGGEPPRNNVNFDKEIGDDKLPVVSRNNLENGQSKNLWYEQVLPRKSRLYFFVLRDDDTIQNAEGVWNAFNDALTKHVVQIGANATIGYGLCKIDNIQI